MKHRILVVDDETDITFMVKHALEQTGKFEVREESCGADTINAAREFKPDIIILDVMMPTMDGTEVAETLAADQLLKKIPVLFLTATVLKEEVDQFGGTIGGHPFLAKPVDVDDLIQCLNKLLASRRSERAGG